MLNIWNQAVRNAQETDLEKISRSSEKRVREAQERVATEDTRSVKKIRITEALDSVDVKALLGYLQHRNLILPAESLNSGLASSLRVVEFFNDREKERASGRYRTAVLLVRDNSSVSTYASKLQGLCSDDINFKIGVYDPSSSSIKQWEDLSCKDLVLVHSHALLDSLTQDKLSLSQIHTLVIGDGELIQNLDSDPIVRIMTNFYRVADGLSKPRVLVMIKSPGVDVGLHYSEFERILDADSFTPSLRRQQELNGIQEETFILDPTTSSHLYPHHAPEVIGRVAAELAQLGQHCADRPLYEYAQLSDGSTICTVVLPPGLPFQRISGSQYHSTTDARRSACYRTCQKLFDQGLLDCRHFPFTDHDRLSLSKSAMNHMSSGGEPVTGISDEKSKRNGVRSYPRLVPEFWTNSLMVLDRLYPTVIFPQQDSDLSPIVLLTRLPLPRLPFFYLFFSGAATRITFQRGRPFSIEDDKLRDLRKYTLRLHRIVGNKPFVCDQKDMPYFLAPLIPSWAATFDYRTENLWDFPEIVSHISWNDITLAANTAFVHIKIDSAQAIDDELIDAVIQDRLVEYTKRYFTLQIRHDLSALHKPSDEEREAGYSSYLEYCKARVRGFEELKNPQTPLVEVNNVPGVLNRLDPTLQPQLSTKGSPKYLIPELCAKCTIPASTLKTTLSFPSILTRINELLLVKELNAKLFSNMISDQLLRIALTPPSAGVDVNYERLEILGDAILKYMSSVNVFITHPSAAEGVLHSHRGSIISNKALRRSAEEIGIPLFILSKIFSAKHWYPANFSVRKSFNLVPDDSMEPDHEALLPGSAPRDVSAVEFKHHKEQCVHQLGDKTLADTMEAIIAAAYLSGGLDAIVPVMKFLTIPVIKNGSPSSEGREALPYPPSSSSVMSLDCIKQVEEIIGHIFTHPYYLVQVLMKSCTSGFASTCFDRLEFLGDGILDFLTMKYIYEREPDLSPGALTLLKSAMVSNSTLATMCVRSGIYQFVDAGAHHLGDSLRCFASAVTAGHSHEHRMATRENRSPRQYWLDLECPKAVSDIMEAILGALYVSDGCSLVGAEKFFDTVFKPFYETYITFKSLSRHATNTVLDLLQKRGCNQYRVLKDAHIGQNRCRVIVHGAVLGESTDSAASTAMRRACEASLQVLIKDLGYLARMCNCEVSKNQTEKAAKKAADVLKNSNSESSGKKKK